MKKCILLIFSVFLTCHASTQNVFNDDFNSNSNNWTVTSEMYLTDGEYHIYSNEIGRLSFINLADLKDQSELYRMIQYDAVFREGLTNQGYGFFFRGTDTKNGFMFLIAAEGYYHLGKLENGAYKKIVDWKPDPDIVKKGKNQIMIMFNKKYIHISINGKGKITLSDASVTSALAKGGIGLYSAKGVHASFDNIKIWDEVTDYGGQ